MVGYLRRPILVGGIGLSVVLWLWDTVGESAVELGETAILGAIALGGGLWWLQRKLPQSEQSTKNSSPINREITEAAIQETETLIDNLATKAETILSGNDLSPTIADWRSQLADLHTAIDRQDLGLAITGKPKVGKTSLKTVLENTTWTQKKLTITEVDPDSLDTLINYDLLIFLVDGDLTEPEYKTLSDLCDRQPTLLVWNKQDQCPLEHQVVVLEKLRQTMANQLGATDIIGISASPSAIKVRQYQDENSVQEWMETPLPQIEKLTENLDRLLTETGEALVVATTYRQAIALQQTVKTHLNNIRRQQALPTIEQYQWVAAAAAFANPVPALDLLATAAITSQLVLDLGKVYDCQFSLEQAQQLAKTLGSQMVKLGLVELSTKTLTTLLKTNTVTYVAGGVIQGVTAAYLTRIAGLSLIEYFQTCETGNNFSFNIESFSNTLKSVFQNNQQLSTLQSFVSQATSHLLPAREVSPTTPLPFKS